MNWKSFTAMTIVCILSIVVIYGTNEVTAYYPMPGDLNVGPYIDEIEFDVISNQIDRILALQAGTIEMDTSFFDSSYYDTLNSDPNIAVYEALRNGYGHITINCRDYPLNISALRRAFAYAYDKTSIVTDLFDGFAQVHDSIVPYPNGWCIEDDFPYHYYAEDATIGNNILDDAGFVIDGGTGFRNAPNGSAFDINIEYASSSPVLGLGVAQAAVDALTALHIDAHAVASDFNDYIARLDNHGDYDMVYYASNYYSNDVDWLAYEFWSGYADVPYQNPSNFANSTYDYWRDQLLYSTSYEEVYQAAAAMQMILQENVPRLVVYENVYLQGYRTDTYTGHVEDIGRYITGPWTMKKIHRLDGTPGGTVNVAIPEEPSSLNIYTANTASSAAILANLYSSLYKYDPNLQPYPDLAESMIVEMHSDNAAVPAGHTRYTIDIIQNATWNDGTPLTAEDIEFTYTYIVGSGPYGNPAATSLDSLVSVSSPSTYRIVLEFDEESYWLFSDFAFVYILPYHIYGTTPYTSWSSAINPYVTSGPFEFTSYVTGDWYKISKNSFYYYLPTYNPPPVVSSAEDLTYTEGTTGHEIVWEVSDDNPYLYYIFKDDNPTPVVMQTWDGSDITLNVDGLSVGTYNYTLFVVDFSANIAYSSIIVTVTPASSTTTTTTSTTTSTTNTTTNGTGGFNINTMTLLITVGGVVVVAIIVVIIWKSKQS